MRHTRLLVLLLIALLVAPFLGQVHRVLHVAVPAHGAVQQPLAGDAGVVASALSSSGVHAPHGGLAALFGDHVDGNDCRLYDQLGHGDLGCGVPALALPAPVPTAFEFAWREGQALARRAALFEARAPPALR